LVAQLTARALARQGAVADLAWLDRFPTTVGAAMEAYLTGADGGGRVRELLAPLAFAEGSGLPVGLLWAALATALGTERYGEQDVRRLLYRSAARNLLQQVRLDGDPAAGGGAGVDVVGGVCYRLFHEALAEYLRSVVPHPEPERVIFAALLDSV